MNFFYTFLTFEEILSWIHSYCNVFEEQLICLLAAVVTVEEQLSWRFWLLTWRLKRRQPDFMAAVLTLKEKLSWLYGCCNAMTFEEQLFWILAASVDLKNILLDVLAQRSWIFGCCLHFWSAADLTLWPESWIVSTFWLLSSLLKNICIDFLAAVFTF